MVKKELADAQNTETYQCVRNEKEIE